MIIVVITGAIGMIDRDDRDNHKQQNSNDNNQSQEEAAEEEGRRGGGKTARCEKSSESWPHLFVDAFMVFMTGLYDTLYTYRHILHIYIYIYTYWYI